MSKVGTPRVKAQRRITDETTSALRKYQNIVVGSNSLSFTIRFELITTLFAGVPGALGFWLRKRFFRSLFGSVGRGVVFGRNITLRHPRKISLGDGVVISDGCVLDAAGDHNHGIIIGRDVILGQNAMLRCKNGDISIGDKTGIGANSAFYAVDGNKIVVGSNALISPFVYVGGGQYHHDRTDIPIVEQGPDSRGGNVVGDNAWLGARVTAIDGAHIGRDTIVSAGSVVMTPLPDFAIASGVPARVIRFRKTLDLESSAS